MHSHEACATSNHDVLHIVAGLKLGCAYEHGGFLPDIDILGVIAVGVEAVYCITILANSIHAQYFSLNRGVKEQPGSPERIP